MKYLICTIIVISITGCKEQIKEGEIVNKNYEPATRTLVMMPIIMRAGNATSTIFIPIWVYDDEDFVLTISDGNESRQLWVGEAEYKDVNIGNWYIVNGTEEIIDKDIKTRTKE